MMPFLNGRVNAGAVPPPPHTPCPGGTGGTGGTRLANPTTSEAGVSPPPTRPRAYMCRTDCARRRVMYRHRATSTHRSHTRAYAKIQTQALRPKSTGKGTSMSG